MDTGWSTPAKTPRTTDFPETVWVGVCPSCKKVCHADLDNHTGLHCPYCTMPSPPLQVAPYRLAGC